MKIIKFIIFFQYFILTNEIIINYLRNNVEEDYFSEQNIWIIILLIIILVILIIVIIILIIKIYKSIQKRNNEKANISVNTERPSQKYISNYNKKRKKINKMKYKERMIEEKEEK